MPDELKPRHEEIAAKAYELYVARGCEPGRDVDDWLYAERQLVLEQAVQQETAQVSGTRPARTARSVKAAASNPGGAAGSAR